MKCKKMGNCTFKAIYFVSVSVWGYYVLKDLPYMPKYLGGSGDFTISMDDHPYAKHAPQLKEYLLLPMGYHLGGLVQIFINTYYQIDDQIDRVFHGLPCWPARGLVAGRTCSGIYKY